MTDQFQQFLKELEKRCQERHPDARIRVEQGPLRPSANGLDRDIHVVIHLPNYVEVYAMTSDGWVRVFNMF